MEKTLTIIEQLQQAGLFESYAIGGGIAALFYIEPVATYDLDLFILLPDEASKLISLTPIYEWLAQKGYHAEKEQVLIENVPVQFIPAFNPLIEEGVRGAVKKSYSGVETNVMRPEYLMAVMLRTNRRKDRERLAIFFEEAEYDHDFLMSVLERHQLKSVYEKFLEHEDE